MLRRERSEPRTPGTVVRASRLSPEGLRTSALGDGGDVSWPERPVTGLYGPRQTAAADEALVRLPTDSGRGHARPFGSAAALIGGLEGNAWRVCCRRSGSCTCTCTPPIRSSKVP